MRTNKERWMARFLLVFAGLLCCVLLVQDVHSQAVELKRGRLWETVNVTNVGDNWNAFLMEVTCTQWPGYEMQWLSALSGRIPNHNAGSGVSFATMREDSNFVIFATQWWRALDRLVAWEDKRLTEIYSKLPPFNLSRDVFQRCLRNIRVMPVRDVGWCDLGNERRIRAVRRYLKSGRSTTTHPDRESRDGLGAVM